MRDRLANVRIPNRQGMPTQRVTHHSEGRVMSLMPPSTLTTEAVWVNTPETICASHLRMCHRSPGWHLSALIPIIVPCSANEEAIWCINYNLSYVPSFYVTAMSIEDLMGQCPYCACWIGDLVDISLPKPCCCNSFTNMKKEQWSPRCLLYNMSHWPIYGTKTWSNSKMVAFVLIYISEANILVQTGDDKTWQTLSKVYQFCPS